MFTFGADLEIGGSLLQRSRRLLRTSRGNDWRVMHDGFLQTGTFGVRSEFLRFQIQLIRAFHRKSFRAYFQRERILIEDLAEMLAKAKVSSARIAVFAGSAKQFMQHRVQ
jgi:hypothetical protein